MLRSLLGVRRARRALPREIEARALVSELGAPRPPLLIDVRTPDEFARDGHIEGARLLPLSSLARRRDELPRDRKVVVVCRTGSRSAVACELLNDAGYDAVNLRGGVVGWRAAGLPLD